MFSGIVESFATVVSVVKEGGNANITLTCPFTKELKRDQSIAHNGVCLTVVGIEGEQYTVTAVAETLKRSNLGLLKEGGLVNVERCIQMNGRLDGHIVQGHVDLTAKCVSRVSENGSWYFTFQYETTPEMIKKGYVTVEKGSVTVNGVSLTVCDSQLDRFSVAIIPYTFEHTNFCKVEENTIVNIEFDILGKYLSRMMEVK